MGPRDRYSPVYKTPSLLQLPKKCHPDLGRPKGSRRPAYQYSKPLADTWSSQVSAVCNPRAACSRKMRQCLQKTICMLLFKRSTTSDRKALQQPIRYNMANRVSSRLLSTVLLRMLHSLQLGIHFLPEYLLKEAPAKTKISKMCDTLNSESSRPSDWRKRFSFRTAVPSSAYLY